MPIGNDLYVNNTLEILRAFLVTSYPIKKRKNVVSGLGLKKEDLNKRPFEGFNTRGVKQHDASSKMFSKRKESLLYDYHIVKLPSNERGKFYGITPIGISYFCNNVEDIDSDTFEKIYSHLKFWYEKGKPKKEESYLEKLESITSNKALRDIPNAISHILSVFKETFSNFKIEHNVEDYIFIKLTYSPTSGMDILLSELIYSDGPEEIDDDDAYSVISDSNEDTLLMIDRYVDVYTFNYFLSKFLIKSFLHSLYSDTTIWCDRLEVSGKDEMPKILKEDLKMKHKILDSFKGEGIGVVKEFQNEINKAVKLYMTAFEEEKAVQ